MERAIVLSQTALSQLLALDGIIREKIEEKLNTLALSPAALANQVKRLKGSDALRLRVGDYRIIFTDDGTVLAVIRVGHRRRVY